MAAKTTKKKAKKKTSGNGANGRKNGDGAIDVQGMGAAAALIEMQQPYSARVKIKGTSDLLFHRYNVEEVAEKAAAPKGSKIKKTDNVEASVWRDEENRICLPGEYLRMACVETGRSQKDPRSPRKSARDLYKAILVAETNLAPIVTPGLGERTEWDYVDQRRAVVQRNAITRSRPGFRRGWEAELVIMVLAQEYLPPAALHAVITRAGMFQGVGDFRPSFGRFAVVAFDVIGPELEHDPRNLFSGE